MNARVSRFDVPAMRHDHHDLQMHEPPSPGPHQRGFTLIEMIMVIVLLGVLSIFVAPVFNRSGFDARGFHDETLAMLRYAQKTAIAQRRTVCVALNATGVALTMDKSVPPDGTCDSAPALPNIPRGGSGLSSATASFNFTPLGSTEPSSRVTISVADSSDITVEADTGYVHD
jgi:MSHA pilin protein MshC